MRRGAQSKARAGSKMRDVTSEDSAIKLETPAYAAANVVVVDNLAN